MINGLFFRSSECARPAGVTAAEGNQVHLIYKHKGKAESMKSRNMRLKNNILLYVIIFVTFNIRCKVNNIEYSVKQKNIQNISLYARELADSLAKEKVDTVVIYGQFCSHCISGHKEKLSVFYRKNGVNFLERTTTEGGVRTNIISGNGHNMLNIILKNKIKIIEMMKDDDNLIEGEEFTEDMVTFTKQPITSGKSHFFYISIDNIKLDRHFCCGYDLNTLLYEKRYSLWALASAFNNEF